MFRRASNRRATDPSVLISNHAVPTNEQFVSPPTIAAAPTEKDVKLQTASTRATVPSIAAASARSHAAIQTDVNRKAHSTLPDVSFLAGHITNLS